MDIRKLSDTEWFATMEKFAEWLTAGTLGENDRVVFRDLQFVLYVDDFAPYENVDFSGLDMETGYDGEHMVIRDVPEEWC